jgi:starch synthase
MDNKLKVIYVSAEISPFAKSGEVAEVASSLPKYLSHLDMDISLFMPGYRNAEIDSLPKEQVLRDLLVPVGEKKVKANIQKSELGKYDIYFIDNPKYFWRDSIYGTGRGDYLDNDERFIFFNRAILEFLLKTKMPHDIIHCNNWPTALVPVFIKTHYAKMSQFKKTATVLTLHNAAYQGEFPPETFALTGLNWNFFNSKQLSFEDKFNFLKAGLIFSDVISTVSSAYKREIETKNSAFGLGKILRSRRDTFFSIRNGIDYEIWNPLTDPYIVANYSLSDLQPKRECKLDLIKEYGLSLTNEIPLIGIMSYLTFYKGFDLLIEAMDELMKMDVGLIVLGRGDEKYENQFLKLQKQYPSKVAVRLEDNPALAHKVVAGADMSLIPSIYEPCGLILFYSFRYGTVPLVRATGGLGETVRPFDSQNLEGNGFVFKEYSSSSLLQTIKDALDSYQNHELWMRIVKAGLKENFSWEDSAKKYARLYRNALRIRRGG